MEKHIKESSAKENKDNKKKGLTPLIFKTSYGVILAAVILFLGYLSYLKLFVRSDDLNQLKAKTIPDAVNKMVGDPNVKVEVGSIKEQSGVYEFELSLTSEGSQPRKFTSYITKDGKIMFQSGAKIDSLAQQGTKASEPEQKGPKCDELSKSDNPQLTAYIVSGCPYGIQMQRVFKKTIVELPQISSSLKVRYIGSIDNGKITSMHGEKEAQENLRQICIREEQENKYWEYVSCYMQEGKSEECLNSAKINTSSLNACMQDKGKGLKYAQIDFDTANKLKIEGSPTLVIGDSQIVSEFTFGGRMPNAIKEILCCASKEKPQYCQKELSKDNIAVSFSKSDESSGGNTTSGCGN